MENLKNNLKLIQGGISSIPMKVPYGGDNERYERDMVVSMTNTYMVHPEQIVVDDEWFWGFRLINSNHKFVAHYEDRRWRCEYDGYIHTVSDSKMIALLTGKLGFKNKYQK